MKYLLLFYVFCTTTWALDAVRYDGYKVFEIIAKDQDSYQALIELQQNNKLDFWTVPGTRGRRADVMVSDEHTAIILDFASNYQVDYKVKFHDVQTLIDASLQEPILQQGPRSDRYALTWDSYYNLSVIYDFCQALKEAYPDLVSVTVAGQSHEGRDMMLLKISSGGAAGKKSIFIDGGIHAREWISPATVTYLIRQLVEDYSAHPHLVDNIDWYFMPVINPDGYEYTHSTDRLWRKTRSTRPVTDCRGTDMNRNFGFHWNVGGSSDDPCSQTYNGGIPFSEIEARAVRDVVLSLTGQLKAYLSFHSYSQVWMLPWGWTSNHTEDYDQLFEFGQRAVNAIAALHGTVYEVKQAASSPESLVSGISHDWVRGAAGVNYSFAVELRDNGEFGFELPASQILPNAEEIWEAVLVLANEVIQMTD